MTSILLQVRLLTELVDHHLREGVRSNAYLDESRGGIYEHKLANWMGLKLENDAPPAKFSDAAASLERRGYVRRNVRRDDYPVLGIRPTSKGITVGKTLIPMRSTYRVCTAGAKSLVMRVVVYLLTSVLLAGFLYAIITRNLPF